jgi:hypothetical protein
MEKVFIVYYDNGMEWDDHKVEVFKVYASRDKADAFVKERMDAINNTPKEQLLEEFWGAPPPRFYVVAQDVEQ